MTLKDGEEFFDKIYAYLGEPLAEAEQSARKFLKDYTSGEYDIDGAEEYEINEIVGYKLEDYIDYATVTLNLLKQAYEYATK